MNRFKDTALTVATLGIGCGILGAAFSPGEEHSLGSVIFSVVMGGFCIVAGLVFLKEITIPAWKNRKKTLKDDAKALVKPEQKGKADADEDDRLISGFRQSVYSFFKGRGTEPNSVIQHTATQLYWHLLYLQKLRMDRKNVSLNFEAERKSYGGISVTKKKFFDGKYEITEAKERIECRRTYTSGTLKYVKNDNELANYSILNAQSDGGSLITCPNCGSKATRENLLDGCDFCGTKFTIEDLGKRISNFALRKDYEVEYAKYKDRRNFYKQRAFLFCAVPVFVFSLICMIIVSFEQKEGILLSAAVSIFGAAFVAGAFGFFGSLGFMFFIFPFIQLKESAKLSFMRKFKPNDESNAFFVKRIKENDPLFSAEHFFSNIQNKLATIHYADKSEQISVFAEKDLSGFLEKYSDIVDMDVTDITLKKVSFSENISRIDMTSSLNLICLKNNGFYETKENVFISLVKNSSCKTEAVCEPFVLRCRECGSSVSLLEGGKCQYCGSRLNLKDYDWVIEDYRVL